MAVAGRDTLLLYAPDLASADTIDLAGVLLAGERPVQLIAGAGGSSLYLVAASDTGGTVVALRRRDGLVIARTALSGVPTVAAMHPDGHTLLVATTPANAEPQERSTLHFLPLDRARSPAETDLCAGSARAMAPSRSLDRLYAACEGGEMSEIDLRLRAHVRTAELRSDCGPVGVGISANATLVYLLCRDAGSLFYVDRARLALFDSMPVGSGATSLAMTPDHHRALVTRTGAGEIAILDLRERSVTARIAVRAPSASAVSGDGRWAYLAGAEGVRRVDLTRPETPGPARPPAAATGLALWPGHSSPVMRWQTASPP